MPLRHNGCRKGFRRAPSLLVQTVIEVVTEKIRRSSRPKSLRELEIANITTVMNLQSGMYEDLHEDEYEHIDFGKTNIKCYDIALSNFWPPSSYDTARILRTIENNLRRPGNVLIHCMSGVDRTGWIIAMYLVIHEGWNPEHAVKNMINRGQHWWFRWWIPFFYFRIDRVKKILKDNPA